MEFYETERIRHSRRLILVNVIKAGYESNHFKLCKGDFYTGVIDAKTADDYNMVYVCKMFHNEEFPDNDIFAIAFDTFKQIAFEVGKTEIDEYVINGYCDVLSAPVELNRYLIACDILMDSENPRIRYLAEQLHHDLKLMLPLN